MKKFLNIYQYITPLLLLPLSYYLWWTRFGENHKFVIFVMSIPIITSYIIPALGTNVTKLWEFDTKIRLGKFRPHHGFVFGTATSLIAFVCVEPFTVGLDLGGVLRSGFVMASVLAFWNFIYDIFAIKAGFIKVYNKQYFEGEGPEAIAMDYAPIYFGVFGLIYGIGIKIGQHIFLENASTKWMILIAIIFNILALTVPTSIFALVSYFKNGYSGVSAYRKGTLNECSQTYEKLGFDQINKVGDVK